MASVAEAGLPTAAWCTCERFTRWAISPAFRLRSPAHCSRPSEEWSPAPSAERASRPLWRVPPQSYFAPRSPAALVWRPLRRALRSLTHGRALPPRRAAAALLAGLVRATRDAARVTVTAAPVAGLPASLCCRPHRSSVGKLSEDVSLTFSPDVWRMATISALAAAMAAIAYLVSLPDCHRSPSGPRSGSCAP